MECSTIGNQIAINLITIEIVIRSKQTIKTNLTENNKIFSKNIVYNKNALLQFVGTLKNSYPVDKKKEIPRFKEF